MKRNILIVSAGKRVALVQAFKETLARFFPETKVYTADMNPEMAPACYVSDGCFKVPKVSDEQYAEHLLAICEENGIGMVIPTIDTELLVLSTLKEEWEKKGIFLIVSDTQMIKICRDKRNTMRFFEQQGIDVPKEVDKHHPTFPLCAKPYDGSSSINFHVINSPEELTPSIQNDPKLIFMEYIDKKVYREFTVDMYYGRDHRVKCIIPRERIEIRAGEINKGRTVKNELIPFLKERLGTIEGCVGCICAQFFMHPERHDIVGIEINPRFGGGYPLSYKCGGNFPEWLIREYFLGEQVEYGDDWKDGMLMLRYDDAIYV